MEMWYHFLLILQGQTKHKSNNRWQMTLYLNVGHTKGSGRNWQLGEEPTSSTEPVTIQLQPSAVKWVRGAELPYFLRETRKTDFYMVSF